MCILCQLYGQKLGTSELPNTTETFSLPAKYIRNDEFMFKLIDWTAVSYLRDNFKKGNEYYMPEKIFPLNTTGDGNCLLHAVSRAMWGIELYYNLLRAELHNELLKYQDFYRECSKTDKDDNSKDFEAFLKQASESGQYLGPVHIFALSNVIKRPIIVYASEEDVADYGQGEGGCCGVYLPTRIGSKKAHKVRPLAVAWSSRDKNHYVPVVIKEGEEDFKWPLPDIAFKSTMKGGERVEDYIHYTKDDAPTRLLELLRKEKGKVIVIGGDVYVVRDPKKKKK
eukprot:TRINITY_DN4135_c1_g1_i1.p1 TRINITY_DN4135_c1_g1~~TRINITY_DN4135_c1_g1_i1.p1  ORF type:complete len:282 (+),score=46.13 TRINITY_DN4135_c1_g1_i1:34-879(+)